VSLVYYTDDESAIANVNYDENGAILANIVTKDDTYVIEVMYIRCFNLSFI
jgi:hypothetical protein